MTAQNSAPPCVIFGLLSSAFGAACTLDDVSSEELATLPPPCAVGWVESADGTRCVRPVDVVDSGQPDTGFVPDAGVSFDSGPDVNDGGTEPTTCFDPQSGTPRPDEPLPEHPTINEYVFAHAVIDGHDIHYYEFVEIYGRPNTDLRDLALIVVNSHSGDDLGVITNVVPVGRTNLAGFWRSCTGWTDELDFFQQASASLFLVRNFSGFIGMDLDTDDNGTLDEVPWLESVDEVGFQDGDAVTDVFYATPVLTNDGFPGHPIPGARSSASRALDGVDTDAEQDWRKTNFSGNGLPGTSGVPRSTEGWVTPGAPNRIQP